MTLLSDVEAALPEEFMTVASIWFNIQSTNSNLDLLHVVRGALDELVNLNKAEYTPDPLGFNCARLYRRARLPQQRAA